MEPFAAPFTVDEVDRRVRSELDFYEKTNARAVFTGFTLTAYLSVRIAKLPLVALVPFLCSRPFFNAGLGTWPDQFRPAILQAVPEAGSAVHLSRRGLTAARVAQAVRQLLESTSVRPRAIELKRLYEAADGAQATADFLTKTVADRTDDCTGDPVGAPLAGAHNGTQGRPQGSPLQARVPPMTPKGDRTDDCTGDPVGAPLAGAPDGTQGRPQGSPLQAWVQLPCRQHTCCQTAGAVELVRPEGASLSLYGRVMHQEDASVSCFTQSTGSDRSRAGSARP